jgi:hypothetical protein
VTLADIKAPARTVEFDPSKVRRTKITLIDPQPEIVVGPVPIPLHLKLHQGESPGPTASHYEIQHSFPALRGEYTRPLPHKEARGFIVFSSSGNPTFTVSWGLTSYPTCYRCRIVLSPEPDKKDLASSDRSVVSQQSSDALTKLMERATTPDTDGVGGEANHDVPRADEEELWQQLAPWEVIMSRRDWVKLDEASEVSAEIQIVSFLDREVLELVVSIESKESPIGGWCCVVGHCPDDQAIGARPDGGSFAPNDCLPGGSLRMNSPSAAHHGCTLPVDI